MKKRLEYGPFLKPEWPNFLASLTDAEKFIKKIYIGAPGEIKCN